MSSVSRMTWKELDNFIREHPDRKGVVVFKQNPKWNKEYSELERSYWFTGDNRHFQKGKIANSIFGYCLDEKSPDADGIRLDWVLYGYPEDRWEVDYCYVMDE